MAFFLPYLKSAGFLDQIHITICNVGSRKVRAEDDYASQRGWDIFTPNLTIYGFDADADACEAANAELEQRQITWKEKHIPLALGKSIGEATLYVTHKPMCSSLYQPDQPFLSRFDQLIEQAGLDFTVEIETTTLDEVCRQEGIDRIDFLQMDVQGAELQVLEGADQILKTVLGMQIEVEFSPLYLGQPLFADVDTYLRARDFSLFDLYRARCRRRQTPLVSTAHPGQLLWGDAFYLCDLLQPIEMVHAKTPEQIFKLACVADAMEFPDYALELLEHLATNYGDNPAYAFGQLIATVIEQSQKQTEEQG
jgi:FkbM family methyltransferase